MSGKIFMWRDIRRIGKSVFTDVPENLKEIKDWTGSVLALGAAAYHVVRGIQHLLDGERDLRLAVWSILAQAAVDLAKTIQLFPEQEQYEMWQLLTRTFELTSGVPPLYAD